MSPARSRAAVVGETAVRGVVDELCGELACEVAATGAATRAGATDAAVVGRTVATAAGAAAATGPSVPVDPDTPDRPRPAVIPSAPTSATAEPAIVVLTRMPTPRPGADPPGAPPVPC